MIFKILGFGLILNKNSYLRDFWNILDFVIVIFGYIPYVFTDISQVNVSVLRSFRILRPLKTISSIENLKILLTTLFSAFPMLMETLILLMFFFLIFAIAGLQIYIGN